MAVSRSDYPPDAVEAAKSVLVELVHVLGEHRDDMVIVGGWVPPLLMPDSRGHVGSTDVDVALNHLAGTDEAYARISESLRTNDYRQDKDQPFIWYREVDAGGEEPITVEVDFLAGEYGGRGKGHRTQHVQDLRPRKARGADLLFDDVEERDVEARLPGGAVDSVTIRVAGVAPYIVMKSSALDTRIKQKDAYDIWFVLANYPGGMSAIVEEFTPFADHGLVLAAVAILERKFESPNHFGPSSVVEVLEQSGEEAALTKRDAFERVQALLAGLQRARGGNERGQHAQ